MQVDAVSYYPLRSAGRPADARSARPLIRPNPPAVPILTSSVTPLVRIYFIYERTDCARPASSSCRIIASYSS